jgi:hypothetical protein
MMGISVCILCYGDYPQLASRCCGSIERALAGLKAEAGVADIRFGLNACGTATREVIEAFATRMADHYPVWLYIPRDNRNVLKYPLMRRMFWDHQHPLSDWVMWFDDDAYLTSEAATASWWSQLAALRDNYDIIGQPMLRHVQGSQAVWMSTQRWYNESAGAPAVCNIGGKRRPTFVFMQGSWWLLRTEAIRRTNWPIPELRHCGGDALFGEVCRHTGLRSGRFEHGVRFNADEKGCNSKSFRRGYDERLIGAGYCGQPLGVDHQQFELDVLDVLPSVQGEG